MMPGGKNVMHFILRGGLNLTKCSCDFTHLKLNISDSTRKVSLIESGLQFWQRFVVGFENRRNLFKRSFETEKHLIPQRKGVTVMKNPGLLVLCSKEKKITNKQIL